MPAVAPVRRIVILLGALLAVGCSDQFDARLSAIQDQLAASAAVRVRIERQIRQGEVLVEVHDGHTLVISLVDTGHADPDPPDAANPDAGAQLRRRTAGSLSRIAHAMVRDLPALSDVAEIDIVFVKRRDYLVVHTSEAIDAYGFSVADLRRLDGIIDGVEVLEAGIYRVGEAHLVAEPGTAQGQRAQVAQIDLEHTTQRVPAVLDTAFGLRFKVVGEPAGAPVRLTVVTRFPPDGLTNPETGVNHAHERFDVQVKMGEPAFVGYTFNETWEAVPGEWVFEIRFRDRLLATQRFAVSTP